MPDRVKEKLVELIRNAHKKCKARKTCHECEQYGNSSDCVYLFMADELITQGVTVQNLDGCEYCNEDRDEYRKMIGAFSITNPFHGNVWNIETCHCKPRQIYFCPMCGRMLTEPPKEV